MSENPTKTIIFKMGRPECLCKPCYLSACNDLRGRYTLKLTPARSQKAKCAWCGRKRYTLQYTLKKEAEQ